jgi:hypothetical protein
MPQGINAQSNRFRHLFSDWNGQGYTIILLAGGTNLEFAGAFCGDNPQPVPFGGDRWIGGAFRCGLFVS